LPHDRQGLHAHEVPGSVDEVTLERIADPDEARGVLSLRLALPRAQRDLDSPQDARARADVPARSSPRHLVQGSPVNPAPFPPTRDAIDQEDMDDDVVGDVVEDVVLDRRGAVDLGTDLREDLVPRTADLRIEVAAERPEVLGTAPVPALHPLAGGRPF